MPVDGLSWAVSRLLFRSVVRLLIRRTYSDALSFSSRDSTLCGVRDEFVDRGVGSQVGK